MKNRNWIETFLFSLIFVIVFNLVTFVLKTENLYTNYIYITPLLLVFITYRYGFNYAIVGHTMSSIVTALITAYVYKMDLIQSLLVYVCYAVAIAIPGLFTKNIHRTLNNKRYKSVLLNIVTSLIVSAIMIGITHYLFNIDSYKVAIQFLIINLIYCIIMARLFPQLILTKRSAYLSSKERSKLLND